MLIGMLPHNRLPFTVSKIIARRDKRQSGNVAERRFSAIRKVTKLSHEGELLWKATSKSVEVGICHAHMRSA